MWYGTMTILSDKEFKKEKEKQYEYVQYLSLENQ